MPARPWAPSPSEQRGEPDGVRGALLHEYEPLGVEPRATPAARPALRARASWSRSEAASPSLLVGPSQPADRPAHRRDADWHAVAALPQLAVVLQRRLRVRLQSWRHRARRRSSAPALAPKRGLIPGLCASWASPSPFGGGASEPPFERRRRGEDAEGGGRLLPSWASRGRLLLLPASSP